MTQCQLEYSSSAAVHTKLVTQPEEGQYFTTISSDGVCNEEMFPRMSIQIPSEVLVDSDGTDGVVRAVSYLYYNVEGLFPSGLPGENQ